MKNIKTAINFANGKMGETDNFDWDIPSISTIEGIKLITSPIIYQNKLSGKILIEIKDDKLYIDFDVSPNDYANTLKSEIQKINKITER